MALHLNFFILASVLTLSQVPDEIYGELDDGEQYIILWYVSGGEN